jgi:hypothetical protein
MRILFKSEAGRLLARDNSDRDEIHLHTTHEDVKRRGLDTGCATP